MSFVCVLTGLRMCNYLVETLPQYVLLTLTFFFFKNKGKFISWDHLVQVYNKSLTTTGLTFLKKLKREHLFLNSYSRMRVHLAAQVSREVLQIAS